jgi:hypothetical protein
LPRDGGCLPRMTLLPKAPNFYNINGYPHDLKISYVL